MFSCLKTEKTLMLQKQEEKIIPVEFKTEGRGSPTHVEEFVSLHIGNINS